MTRCHFAYLARTIAGLPETVTREQVVKEFATHLADTNPKFNREKFVEACGAEV